MSEAQRITLALRGRLHGAYGVAFCPAHPNRRTPALSLADGGGGRLLALCHAGCGFAAVLDALRGLGLISGTGRYRPPDPADLARLCQAREAEAAKRQAQALACWREARPIGDTLAERYLRARGIRCPLPETLRFHPDCWHPAAKRLPALVAMVEGAERFAVHRTYLAEPGRKADADPVKGSLGPVKGGAVHLSAGIGPLVVAEGIETALTLLDELRDMAPRIWAAASAEAMEALGLPQRVGDLVIAPDPDARGRGAAETLASRAFGLGWRVRVIEPPACGDWNDAACGAAA